MQVKKAVFSSALNLVKQLGWNDYALLKAVEEHSLSPASARALFPDGTYEIAEQLMIDWENKMSMDTSNEELEGLPLDKQLSLVLKKRLSYEEEFMPGWREAMLAGAQFKHLDTTWNRLFSTMNTVWDMVGDESAGMEWYSKRLGLLQVFIATECHMLHDATPGFANTYQFLEQQLQGRSFAHIGDLFTLYFTYGQYIMEKAR